MSLVSIISPCSILLDNLISSKKSDHELERTCLRVGKDQALSTEDSIGLSVWYGDPLG